MFQNVLRYEYQVSNQRIGVPLLSGISIAFLMYWGAKYQISHNPYDLRSTS